MSVTQPKFSIIVCSVKPEMAKALSDNIRSTIGVEYEMIIFDNRQAGKGICAVYNECAERAAGEYLLFVHEDVAFHTEGWGRVIGEKLSEPLLVVSQEIRKPLQFIGYYFLNRIGSHIVPCLTGTSVILNVV